MRSNKRPKDSDDTPEVDDNPYDSDDLADVKANPSESQAAAVAAIRKLGGMVTFDEKNSGKPLAIILRRSKVTETGLEHFPTTRALSQIGSDAKVAVPALQALKNDPACFLQFIPEQALEQIEK
ncbi:MAG: hypothetical protein ACI9G1_000621 [Pirellulaceae bacterium]|jgi:hypothetical protein